VLVSSVREISEAAIYRGISAPRQLYRTDAQMCRPECRFRQRFSAQCMLPDGRATVVIAYFATLLWSSGALAQGRAGQDVRARAAGCQRAAVLKLLTPLKRTKRPIREAAVAGIIFFASSQAVVGKPKLFFLRGVARRGAERY